jgi:hypothetical protein
VKYTLKEHQAKKLVPKELEERVGVISKASVESVQKLSESAKGKPKKLIVQMEAIHVGRTKNYTFYTKEGLSAGVNSWTTPYNKPVLTHHNDYDGEPIGRILKAEFSESTRSGKAGLIFTVEITDPDAIEKVLDGRYQTVSIGASTDKVTCNICGTDRTKEWCDHWPGEEYEGQTAHFIIGTTFGREVSYVNTPADEFAGNFSVEAVHEDQQSGGSTNSQESVHAEIFQIAEGLFQNIRYPDVNLYESLSEDMKATIKSLLTFEERSNQNMDEDQNTQTPETPVQEGEQPAAPGAPVQEGEQNQPAVPEAGAPVQEGEQTPATPTGAPATLETPVSEAVDANKVAEMQRTITNLVLEKQRLEARVNEMDQENKRLLKENAELHAAAHKALAEKVVDLKRSLNKPDVVGVEREEAIANHAARTKESLENTLQDLLLEAKQQRPEPGSVTNPGYSGEESEEGDKQISIAEATNILSSMFSAKRKK